MQSSPFSPEVQDYMILNGYKLLDDNKELGLLTFRRGNVCVVFWQDRIERRIISADKEIVSRLTKSFKGFDGKDIFQMMLVLHVIAAVDLKDVKKRVMQENGKQFTEIMNDLISTIPQ